GVPPRARNTPFFEPPILAPAWNADQLRAGSRRRKLKNDERHYDVARHMDVVRARIRGGIFCSRCSLQVVAQPPVAAENRLMVAHHHTRVALQIGVSETPTVISLWLS